MMCLYQEGKVSVGGVCEKGHSQLAPGGDRGLHHGGPFRPRYDILTVEWGGICWPWQGSRHLLRCCCDGCTNDFEPGMG